MALLTPEFLQTKTYSALRDRVAFAHGGPVQPGVWAAGDYKVSQRASGANMSVDVAAGDAIVPANDSGNSGLYHQSNDATVNVATFTAANATNPRIDMVILRVNDTTHGGDLSDVPSLEVVTGTSTAGATLDNRTGAGSLPTGAILIADVLIPAASTSIVTANIRDRRPWARGAYCYISTATTFSTTVNSPALISSSILQPRIELSGTAFRATVRARWAVPAGGAALHFWRNGANQVNMILNSGSKDEDRVFQIHSSSGTAGSALFGPAWEVLVNTQTLTTSADGIEFVFEEIIRPSANNT